MGSQPPERRPGRKTALLGCYCQGTGAILGVLSVLICALAFLPWPAPDAPKPIREARGVYAFMLGLCGFIVGALVGGWVGKAIGRRADRK
jgi:hypothetical protein